MDTSNRIICTICARGGSKGVKNKNIKLINGKPLIAHTILQAIESNIFEKIVVSSDSKEILDIAGKYGVDLLINRPSELANDFISKIPAIRHAVKETEATFNTNFTLVVDMDPTSPLRNIYDIKSSINLLIQKNISNVITGSPSRRSPYFNLVEKLDNEKIVLSKKLKVPIFRRQDSPRCYDMNASIYVWKKAALFEFDTVFNSDTELYEMPENRSVDIDNELDFMIVEYLLKNKLND
jgi:CMP-N,N'-diacetyllegionaminic acid synthase